ncbi:MAG: hypothetical protein EPO68_14275 [Planctomycetota bacterium]|nr:MAG: hypothetical protein EPO68_14275 [Planctomycetota bacterium]
MRRLFLALLIVLCGAPLFARASAQDLDARARADGAAQLARMLEASGGLAAWRAQGGAAWDVLDTLRVQPEPDGGEWRVHHRVARRAVFDPAGQGWLHSEYARYDEPSARVVVDPFRQVSSGDAAWAEHGGRADRAAPTAARARDAVRREFLLGALPFALAELGAEVRALEPGALGDRRVERVAVHLPSPVVMEDSEAVADFELLLDPETARPLRLAYTLVGADRDDPERGPTQAWIDFSGRLEVGKVFLPARRELFHAGGTRRLAGELARASAGAPAPAGLRRPWISGLVWSGAERATSWDPPARGAPRRSALESAPSGGR